LSSLHNIEYVLDIACGDGHFLERFKELGCQVYGTEYDRESTSICEAKGITMLSGSFMPQLPDRISAGFDLVILTEVIEHINNPNEVLGHIYKLLKPGGLIFITTPNFDSLERLILGPKWGIILYPEHISYYSPKTLDIYFNKTGV
jgi:2-polyprenyl-3-methyl-5-hydroxy-6-metoxy-1,4-benzoquinol methylase